MTNLKTIALAALIAASAITTPQASHAQQVYLECFREGDKGPRWKITLNENNSQVSVLTVESGRTYVSSAQFGPDSISWNTQARNGRATVNVSNWLSRANGMLMTTATTGTGRTVNASAVCDTVEASSDRYF